MDLHRELDRLTEPPFCRSDVRLLSRDEIAALEQAGQVTPVEQIPAEHMPRRLCYPERRCGSSIRFTYRSRCRGAL